jgi:hypothetical protein
MKIGFRVLPLIPTMFGCLLAATVMAVPALAEGGLPSRATLINACIQDIRSGVKAGQVLSNSQRMLAEEQCRAYADSQIEKAARRSGDATGAKAEASRETPATERR